MFHGKPIHCGLKTKVKSCDWPFPWFLNLLLGQKKKKKKIKVSGEYKFQCHGIYNMLKEILLLPLLLLLTITQRKDHLEDPFPPF